MGPALSFAWFPKRFADGIEDGPRNDFLEFARILAFGPRFSSSPGPFRFAAFFGIGPGSAAIQTSSDTSLGTGPWQARAELSAGYMLVELAGFEFTATAHALTQFVLWGGGLGLDVSYRFGRAKEDVTSTE